jgi:hypothetical protein
MQESTNQSIHNESHDDGTYTMKYRNVEVNRIAVIHRVRSLHDVLRTDLG